MILADDSGNTGVSIMTKFEFYPPVNELGLNSVEIFNCKFAIWTDVICPHCNLRQPVAATNGLGGRCSCCKKKTALPQKLKWLIVKTLSRTGTLYFLPVCFESNEKVAESKAIILETMNKHWYYFVLPTRF